MLSFNSTFSLSSFTFIKRLFSSSLLSATRGISADMLMTPHSWQKSEHRQTNKTMIESLALQKEEVREMRRNSERSSVSQGSPEKQSQQDSCREIQTFFVAVVV